MKRNGKMQGKLGAAPLTVVHTFLLGLGSVLLGLGSENEKIFEERVEMVNAEELILDNEKIDRAVLI